MKMKDGHDPLALATAALRPRARKSGHYSGKVQWDSRFRPDLGQKYGTVDKRGVYHPPTTERAHQTRRKGK
jgi:hypothetical protein